MNGTTPVAGGFTYTVTPAGAGATPVAGATVLVVGSYTLTANFAPTDTVNYLPVSASFSLTVTRARPAISLVSSLNPALLTNSVTLTATVSSAASTPSGTVTFLDGTTVLSSAQTLTQGASTYTTANFALGGHSITVVYSGDANFTGATSAALIQTTEDFSLAVANGGSASVTALPGGTATTLL